jgi:hypothetical protein
MEDISGSVVVRAFCAMGHRMRVQTETNEVLMQQLVRTTYWPPGEHSYVGVDVTISLEAMMRADQPEDLIADAVGDAIDRLVTTRVRHDVLRVMKAMQAGPLDGEFVGGPRDGEVISGLPTDRDGWPLPWFYVPLSSPPLPSWKEGSSFEPYPAEITRVGAYERDWVSPATCHWRYLWAKS